jgi:phosphoglycolate phosphatase
VAIVAGLNAVFGRFGMPEWTLDDVKGNVRRSLRETFPEMFGARWEEARDVFYAEVQARHLGVLTPMPGAAAAVAGVAALGLPQGVISNKQGPLLRAEAGHLGWAGHFRCLVGAGDAAADKPHRAPFEMASPALGLPAGVVLWYVGDTALDMAAARAWGCVAVLVGDAAHDGGVAAAAPDLHFPDPGALLAALG